MGREQQKGTPSEREETQIPHYGHGEGVLHRTAAKVKWLIRLNLPLLFPKIQPSSL